MKIFHRIDDIQEYNDEIKEILDYFEKNTEEFILSVVPKKFDKRFAEIIKSYKHCTVYQHGYEHENHVEKGWCDEFPDTISYSQRRSLISLGKEKLEEILGHQIKGYVPPWNNTGNETVSILSELGFKTYSAQENNTVHYENKKDIMIDVIDKYLPYITYKDLSHVYLDILSISSDKTEIGIMYHFKNTKPEDWELIQDFIQKVERLNSN